MPDDVQFDIRREGRAWTGREEIGVRWDRLPEKWEVVDGRLLWTDEELRHALGVLLEQVGTDAAVKLGDPMAWRDSVRALDERAG